MSCVCLIKYAKHTDCEEGRRMLALTADDRDDDVPSAEGATYSGHKRRLVSPRGNRQRQAH